LFLPPVFLQL
jgi:hypothetical protein